MKITGHDIFQAASAALKTIDLKPQENQGNKGAELNIATLSKEGQVAVKMIDEMGVSVSEADAKVIDKFMQEGPGSLEEKLAALTEVIKKELPMTEVIVNDLNQARKFSLADFIKGINTTAYGNKKKESEHLAKEVNVKAEIMTKLDSLLTDLLEEAKIDESSKKFIQDGKDEAIDEDFISLLGELLSQGTDLSFMVSDANSSASAQMILEQRVTERLAAVKSNFEQFKSETLDLIKNLTDPSKGLSADQKADALSKIIDKIDHAIMKSEIGMYIDMQGEKTLLQQSSNLSDARTALGKGNLVEAERIVKDVFKILDELNFKPTIQKAIAVGNPFTLSLEELNYSEIVKWAKTSVEQFSFAEKSPALLLNYLRRMGINHEVEAFQKTFGEEQAKDKAPRDLQNLKSMLLALAKSGKESEVSEKILSHINGQQINLKLDDKPQPQNLMLSIPMSMDAVVGDVKVFIKSQQQDLKLDWRNFNMFFVLDTKRFGEVGIKVSSIDKNLNIEIKNDNDDARVVIEPLAQKLSDYVEEIGFNVSNIHFDRLLGEHPNKVKPTKEHFRPQQKYSDREFDFQI